VGGGLAAVKQVGGGGEIVARWSRGHRRGPTGWGGCTRRCGAWGGIETVGGGLEGAVRGGSIWPERNGGGGVKEQLRAPPRRSEELPMSLRSSGR
jgi:hypothetical protein